MRCTIVVEGESDKQLFERLLQPDIKGGFAEIMAGNGRHDADSLARSVLVVRPNPVALVLDSDTTNAARLREQRALLEESLGMVSSRDRFKVCLAVPEIEVIFFESPAALAALEAAAKRSLSSVEKIRANFEPKKVLVELLGGASRYSFLTQEAIDSLHATTLLREIRDFIDQSTGRARLAG